jgi:uncharacterized membrane protein HdeD (DUF308 family)
MFVAPGSKPGITQILTHEVAERLAKNWWKLLLNGILLIVVGVLVFSIDWTVRSLATFIGAVFIAQGVFGALETGVNPFAGRANVLTGLLKIAAGVVIVVWPSPGLLAVAIVLGAWLIVSGTIAVAGAFAARELLSDWWMLLIIGVLEVALGVLALADPGATLAALVTVAGIWAVAAGAMYVVFSFEVKRLPDDVDRAFTSGNGEKRQATGAGASKSAPIASVS